MVSVGVVKEIYTTVFVSTPSTYVQCMCAIVPMHMLIIHSKVSLREGERKRKKGKRKKDEENQSILALLVMMT